MYADITDVIDAVLDLGRHAADDVRRLKATEYKSNFQPRFSEFKITSFSTHCFPKTSADHSLSRT